MRLIIAEKPSMGRAIASALGLPGSGRSLIQGEGLLVTWCVGHLVEAVEPHIYDEALRKWTLGSLPFFPETFRYAPIEQTKDQYDVVARLLSREDITEVVNATDAGREGELIFDLVYRLAGATKPVLRFWASSLTDEAIREAYGAMKPGAAYEGLRDAARCRQEADWLVGINGTRAQTLVMRRAGGEGVYSIGRVQTPTLAILVHRELEVRDFVPKDFWTLWAVFQTPEGSYRGKWFKVEGPPGSGEEVQGTETDRFDTEAEVIALAERLKGLPGKVLSVTAKTEKKRPELLYDLTSLQKEANKRYGFTAEHTLEVAQELYEQKLLSYPRTSSRHLTEADAAKAAGLLKALGSGQLQELQPFLEDLRKRWPVKLDKRFVNDKEVEDHPALTPTETPARNLSGDRLKLYELVARRFLAAFFPERIEAKTTVITIIDQETFRTRGTIVKQLGWSEVDPPHRRAPKEKAGEDDAPEEGPDESEAGELPPLKKGQGADVREVFPKTGKTSPPKRMTEADLLSAMQGAGRLLDDESLRGAMKDCGLGTPATRANIIETLLRRDFVTRKRNVLVPTDKGMELIRSLKVDALTSPQLTGSWEARMERIRRGHESREAFMADIRAFVADMVAQQLAQAPARPRRVDGPVVGPCPRCGSDLHLRTWEERHYVACDGTRDPECRVSYGTDASGTPLERCPACGAPVRRTRDGRQVCVGCSLWLDAATPVPPTQPCPRCGQAMRLIPSTRRGEWFLRCAPCGVTLPSAPR